MFSCAQNLCKQLFAPRALFGGKRDKANALVKRQRLADEREIRLDLALFELVKLVCDN